MTEKEYVIEMLCCLSKEIIPWELQEPEIDLIIQFRKEFLSHYFRETL